MPISEFQLIETFLKRTVNPERFPLGIGDDCAALNVPAGEQLLLSVDTLVEAVHFPRGFDPGHLARRALAVSVSDLAACGARPLAYTLALTLPSVEESWLARFATGLHQAADDFGLALIGGDTTRGPLCLSLQVMGSAPPGEALLRSGARPDDDIYVSGYPGEARAALDLLDQPEPSADQLQLLQRYFAPTPRLALGQALRGIASAAIDVSDGLAADLGHILKASGVGGQLELAALPQSSVLLDEIGPLALDYVLSGGDDYELCFTAAPDQREAIDKLARRLKLPLTRIGQVCQGSGLRCRDQQGGEYPLPRGYQHF